MVGQNGRRLHALAIIIALSVLFLAPIHTSNAQDLTFDFAIQLGGTDSDDSNGVITDASNNIYATGGFRDTVDFDPGAGTANLTAAGIDDVFVVKFDPTGVLVWAKAFSGTNDEEGYDIAVDAAGNVYVVGLFQGTVDFDPGAATANLTSAGSVDFFIVKLDSSGDLVWAKSFGGTSTDYGYGISLDSAANVYATGLFYDTVDFDPGAGTANLTSAGDADTFVLKLDTDGDYVWAHAIGSTGYDGAARITADASGNNHTVGIFENTVDFDPGVGTTNLTSAGAGDGFVVKLNASGDFVWAKGFGSTGTDIVYDASLDAAGNVHLTGKFQNTVDFDPGAGTTNLTSAGNDDAFVTKLDASGNFLWAKAFGGTDNELGFGVTVDSSGGVYSTGTFETTVDFDPGAGTSNLTSAGSTDVYVSKLDVSGDFVWAKAFSGTGGLDTISFTLDSERNIIANGQFAGTADFDPAAGTANMTASGVADVFIAKLIPPPNVTSITRTDTNPSSAGSVDFTVTFDRSVTGVDTSDFTIDASGVTGASITNVSGSGTTYTVSVSTGSGDGTLSIDLADDDTIVNSASVPLGDTGAGNGDYTSGEAYTIDKTVPTVSIGTPSTTDTINGPVTFPITYSGATSVNLTAGDLNFNTTGSFSFSFFVTNGTTATPTVHVTGFSGNGTLAILIGANVAADAAGNTAAGAGPSATITIDNIPPTASIGAPSTSNTAAGPVSFGVTYSGATAVNLVSGDISLNTTGTANASTINITNGTSSTPTVTLSGITGNGTLGISIAGSVANDAAGNVDAGAGPSTTFAVDNFPPVAGIGSPSLTDTATGPVAFGITYSGAASVNLVNGDVVLNTTGTATASTISVTNGTTTTPTVTLSGISGDGTLGISLGGNVATDGVGNVDLGAGPSSTFNVDNIPPTVSIGTPSSSDTASGPVSFGVTYSGVAAVNLVSGDITLNTSGTATASTINVTNGTSGSPTVTLSGITGDGTLGISIAANVANDTAGNADAGAGPSTTFTVDNTGPTVTVSSLITSDSTPALMGTINDASATVSVTVDGQTNPAMNNGTSWSLGNDELNTLAAGSYNVQVTATDVLGNIDTDGTDNELTIEPDGGGGIVTSNLYPQRTAVGARLELTAPAGGTDYRWKKNGVFLTNGGTRSGVTTRTLVIDPLALSDSGVYSCQYENGTARSVVETEGYPVIVLAVPVAMPIDGTAFLTLLAGCFILTAIARLCRIND